MDFSSPASTAQRVATSGTQPVPVQWPELRFDNRYARLPGLFHTRLEPTAVPDPELLAVSSGALALIGLNPSRVHEPAFVEVFAGNRPLAGAEPFAAVYSGHQFGIWAGQLGDGRAISLGEVLGPEGRMEIQLKGCGRTPYSRGADGRAVLRSSIREFLCSEAMAALGIPTTRAMALVASPLPVLRESVETAAVVTRLAPSFVRFGTFEHFYAAGRLDAMRTLADHVVGGFFPALVDAPNPYLELLREVLVRTATLVAHWQAVGFCHGVLNTDNLSILGLTIDYGPFGFLDGFDAGHICNHSDHTGRYRYSEQPAVAHWNLHCLAQALLPLITERGASVDDVLAILAQWPDRFSTAWHAAFAAKLGLQRAHPEDDALLRALLACLQADQVDFTGFFRRLSRVRCAADETGGDDTADECRALFVDHAAFDAWLARYRARLALEERDDAARARAMDRVNPKYVLRNHLAETAIRRAREGDYSEVRRLHELLEHPYDEQPGQEAYAALPPGWASTLEVSCSS